MKPNVTILALLVLPIPPLAAQTDRVAPPPEERQLPLRMHSKMSLRPSITVGSESGEISGKDNRVLQAAVDYIAGLGGGSVHILEGEYLMKDSLHLRPHVSVTGIDGREIPSKTMPPRAREPAST